MIIVMVVSIIFCFVCRYLSYLSALPYFYLKNIYLKTLCTFFFIFLNVMPSWFLFILSGCIIVDML